MPTANTADTTVMLVRLLFAALAVTLVADVTLMK